MSLHVPTLTAATVEEMRQLVADLDAHRREVEQAFTEGFTVGFQEGDSVGYGRAHVEMAEQWSHVYRTVQNHARQRTFAEITKIRGEVA